LRHDQDWIRRLRARATGEDAGKRGSDCSQPFHPVRALNQNGLLSSNWN
jgi:hypothetical protein